MAKYFSIQVFSSDGRTAITKKISKPLLVTAFVILILVVLGILVTIGFYGRVYVKALKVRNLEERNKYLEEEFKKVEKLEKDIAEIGKQREKLEVVLGLKGRRTETVVNKTEPERKEEISEDKNERTVFENPEMAEYIEESKQINKSMPNLIPVNGWLTKRYDVIHKGVDIAAPVGTPIFSALDGKVSFVGWDSILGNVVKVEGMSGYTTVYGHCSNIFAKKGDFIRKGEIIASVGKTGIAEAPHLHYEIIANSINVNPELFFIKSYGK